MADVWLEDAFPEPAAVAEEDPEQQGDAAWVELPRGRLGARAGLYREQDGIEVRSIGLTPSPARGSRARG